MVSVYKNLPLEGGASLPIDAEDIANGIVNNTEFDWLDGTTSSIQDQLNGKISTTLADGKILLGDAANAAQQVAITGDVTISNSGVAAISSNVIVNADIKTDAAIEVTKLQTLTADRVLTSSSGGVITPSSITTTTLSYLDPTSSIQTQLNTKLSSVSGGDHTTLTNIGTNSHSQIDTHIANTSNPHSVTKSQVGLGSCDNTSDVNKPVSTATQTALDAKLGKTVTDGKVLIGNASNLAAEKNFSGAITVDRDGVATLANNIVTNAKSAQMATNTIKGNNTGGASDPIDLTATQTTAILNAMVGDSGSGGTKGLVPAPASGDAAALKFLKADGTWATPTGSPSFGAVRLHTYSGYGSTNTKIMIFTTNVGTTGTLITYATSSTNGASFTINANAFVTVSFNSDFGASNSIGISLNSSELTTNIGSITAANRLALSQTPAAGVPTCVSFTGYVASGGVIRPHTTGAAANTASNANFTISAIAV